MKRVIFMIAFWLIAKFSFSQKAKCQEIEITKCNKVLRFKDFYQSAFDEALTRFELSSQVPEWDSVLRIWWIDRDESAPPSIFPSNATMHLIELKLKKQRLNVNRYSMQWKNSQIAPDSFSMQVQVIKKCLLTSRESDLICYAKFKDIEADRIFLLPKYSRLDDTTGDDFKFLQYLYGDTRYTIDFSRRHGMLRSVYKREIAYIKLLNFLKEFYGIDPPINLR